MADERAPLTYCFDLDGTLCTNTWGDYADAQPFTWAVARVNALAAAGHRIVIHTARGSTTGIDWGPVTRDQLARWGIHYDELVLGKPQADVYVDDRTQQSDSWRFGSPSAVPMPGASATELAQRGVPSLAAPRSTTVVEVARTSAGRPVAFDAHAQRALARADGFGLAAFHTAAELRDAAERAVAIHAPTLAPGDDLVVTLAVGGTPLAGYIDTLDAALDGGVTVSIRPLSQATAGLRGMLGADGLAAELTHGARWDGAAWPLRASGDTVIDLLGGRVAVLEGDTLILAGSDTGVPCSWLREAAASLRIDVEEAAVAPDRLRSADAAIIAGMPFVALPVSSIDRCPLTGSRHTNALLAAVTARLGIDPLTQVRDLAGR